MQGDVQEGMARYYHPNGQLYGTIQWSHGRKTGGHLLYREDGTQEQYLSYADGQLDGLAAWTNEEGNVKQYAFYQKGRLALSQGCFQKNVSLKDILYQSETMRLDTIRFRCAPHEETPLPSFNCARATLPIEKLICTDVHVSRLDREISETYRDLQKYGSVEKFLSESDREKVRNDQRLWLKQRDACLESPPDDRTHKDCLNKIMTQRVKSLNALYSEAKNNWVDQRAQTIGATTPSFRKISSDKKFTFYDDATYKLYEGRNKILDEIIDEPLTLVGKGEGRQVRTCRSFIEARQAGVKEPIFEGPVPYGYDDCEILRLLLNGSAPQTSFMTEETIVREVWRGIAHADMYPSTHPIRLMDFGYKQPIGAGEAQIDDGSADGYVKILVRGQFRRDGGEEILVEEGSSWMGASRHYGGSTYKILTQKNKGGPMEVRVKSCGIYQPCDTD